jgi:3'-phosphoadenosine 5'-phosphosulfate sulfotransferase (PAPS reductase)/FAD synthetase
MKDLRIRLEQYDWIVVSTSGGKDSQTMLRKVVSLCEPLGIKDRIVATHADMKTMEFPGVPELAAEQAAHYGVRFEIVTRPQGDLLQHVRDRAKKLRERASSAPPVPSPSQRYCTSDHKRDQIAKLMTTLTDETRAAPGHAIMPWMKPSQRYCTSDHKRDPQARLLTRLGRESGKRKVRILQCMGMRADESPARAKLRPFYLDRRNSNGKKTVHIWLPIHQMSVDEVWADVRASGVRYHWAYEKGMPRLSCAMCIFAPKAALVLAARLMPELAQEYLKVEQEVGFSFRKDLPMAEVIRAAESGEDCGKIVTWEM